MSKPLASASMPATSAPIDIRSRLRGAPRTIACRSTTSRANTNARHRQQTARCSLTNSGNLHLSQVRFALAATSSIAHAAMPPTNPPRWAIQSMRGLLDISTTLMAMFDRKNCGDKPSLPDSVRHNSAPTSPEIAPDAPTPRNGS